MTTEKRDPQNPDAPSKQEQKDQQRSPELQSYVTGEGDGKAADPDENLIIEDDPRFQRSRDDKQPDAL